MKEAAENQAGFLESLVSILAPYEPIATILIPIIGVVAAILGWLWKRYFNKPPENIPVTSEAVKKGFITEISEKDRYDYNPTHRALVESLGKQRLRKRGATTIFAALWFSIIAFLVALMIVILF